ncbi:1-deoxy-D-xylulose-5-phosphate synthase N-terminal domain-containing protein [Methylobacterium persicinum]|uniref:Pyruvate dehydrogenase E1 component n=1 Tax=Methylobacterium persicinum TaxID=374426 RepID=A0ABU0HI22_9HYPH|nr:1-deoxy-D-xylulose-5-phosphate synthase N-terminal domain-containing protein [Methylobacterium persicinum]MDQ0441982.1 pyruvate dehydrogenase E1 component [Methylobacterium persicinum]GJE38917.1 Pyruvate dehydrogenase E1 component [Methylobacterium persicinum]
MSPAISADTATADPRLSYLAELERRALWLSTWMIHNANHIRPNHDGMKVGGHQASSASLATILTALYYAALRPEDRVAVKPHAGPVFHALQYIAGRQTQEKLENFRGFGGVQSYPSRTKDTDDVDFSTGSVGLGVAQTLFGSLVQDYVRAHGWGLDRPEGRMVALVGDAEMDEGNIFEALMEGWKHGLRRTWWIIDYNRQSLDAVIREGLYTRFEEIFRSFGWDVVVLKYGSLMDAAFAEPGGERLRDWIDTAPNQLYAALTFQGGAAWRKRLNQDLAGHEDALALVARRNDEQLAALMGNLGGHDMVNLLKAFEAADNDRPTVFIAYTVKGYGLPLAGHKDNHSGLLTPAQTELFREKVGVRAGREWEPFEGLQVPEQELRRFIEGSPFFSAGPRRYSAPKLPVPEDFPCPRQASLSTQAGFGIILNELAKADTPLASRIVTTSPDVTVSTNLGGWVNRRGLFAKEELRDLFKSERIPSTFNWDFSTKGQHLELGIAEMNLFLLLSALGLSDRLFGERLIPIGTLYDPFICRGLDALNYACYQDARFIIAATPSGVTLAPEGGAHQSINTPLIGMAQDGLTTFEPAFVDELSIIMAHAFDFVQREGKDGGSVYLRLSTRSLTQPQRTMNTALAQNIIEGAYWLREPGPNADLVVAVTGAPTPEAIEAVGLMAEDRRDIGLLAVTSYDRLHAGWSAAQRAREAGDRDAWSHVEDILDGLPAHCGLVTVVDGHPATLGWLGSVHGHRTRALGIERFGQTGTVADLYRHYGLDAEGIAAAANGLSPERPIRLRGYGHRIGRSAMHA